jgi:hypothetical protein
MTLVEFIEKMRPMVTVEGMEQEVSISVGTVSRPKPEIQVDGVKGCMLYVYGRSAEDLVENLKEQLDNIPKEDDITTTK